MSAAAGRAFRRFWASETGPKTVHFWAPTLKWGLVIAGISDAQRPVEKVSGTQNLSLMATAVIWSRWSFVIKPRNYLLASVNFFLGLTASYQLMRITKYRLNQGDNAGEVVRYIFSGEGSSIKGDKVVVDGQSAKAA
ncbi:mitochondrial pyruvate carrier Ecym_5567 [Eremothecium cymbalariae DBVPG|uniref:Mitochondrial pyruvate carrier n=1 Tax=Eremothecium cymbalariae (strain CBS 270.75 / DBVPG 7215 / KCTC 17166 / NRRL Y-17582) TaxID=931890 RepID=I6NE13_ERECY|nr:hypothetical protein Ecym_5567 [Eremothecium cymbalariae DBVPG\